MEFPHNNWYLEFEEKDREIVDNWRINIIKFSPNPCFGNIINCVGRGAGEWLWKESRITIEQFKEHILNIKETIEVPSNYSYLSPLLNKLKEQIKQNEIK